MTDSMGDLLQQQWYYLDDEATSALQLALGYGRYNGRNRVRTRYLVAALRTQEPSSLKPLLAELEEAPLPDPVLEGVEPVAAPHKENPSLSPCVASTLRALGSAASSRGEISGLDLFVDLLVHGGGSTVSQLREAGYGSDRLRTMLDRLGLEPLERSPGRTAG